MGILADRSRPPRRPGLRRVWDLLRSKGL